MDNTNNLNAPDNDGVQNPAAGTEIKPTNEPIADPAPKASIASPEPLAQPALQSPVAESPMSPSTQSPVQRSQPQPFFTDKQPMTIPTGTTPSQPVKGKKSQKIIFAAVIAAFLLIGGTAAAYLGVYLPNQPEHVWETALTNTATGYDKLLAYEEGQKDMTTTKIAGDYRIEASGEAYDGSYSIEGDAKKGKLAFDVGVAGSRIKLEALTEIKETSPYPDVYFRAEGVDAFEPFFNGTPYQGVASSVNNQWYFADHSLFDQMMADTEQKETPYTSDDVRAFMRAIGEVNREYVFTTEPSKAVLENREYVGEEVQDDRKTFHYKVGLHKENTKAYVKAMAEKISQTELYKGIAPEEDQLNVDGLVQDIDSFDTSRTADVWVDTGTKLIRTVRLTEKDTQNYFDIGLKYTGGDEFPFYMSYQGVDSDGLKGEAQMTMTLNTVDDTLKIDATITTEDNSVSGYLKGMVTRSNNEVSFEAPSDAKSITELMGIFYGGEGFEEFPTDDVLGISTPFELLSN